MSYNKYFEKAGLPSEEWALAEKCIKEAKKGSPKVLLTKMVAPIVCAFVVPTLKWEAEAMPKFFRYWDNNRSINGDNAPWIGDKMGPMPLEDTPEVRALCYWAKGHHPRSNWARYVWLGLRNKASWYAKHVGKQASTAKFEELRDKTRRIGDERVSIDKREGCAVFELEGIYQIFYNKLLVLPDWKIFSKIRQKYMFRFTQNLGFKVGNAKYDEGYMSLTYKTFAIVRFKQPGS